MLGLAVLVPILCVLLGWLFATKRARKVLMGIGDALLAVRDLVVGFLS